MCIQKLFYLRMTEEIIHYILSFLYRLRIFQREKYPTTQHTRTHRRNSLIDHIQQAGTFIVHRTYQFQATHGKFIQAHIPVFFDTRQGGDMRNMFMFCLIQIVKDCSRSNNTQFQMLYAETFQVLRLKMLQQAIVGCLVGENPIIHFKSKETGAERLLKTFAVIAFDQYFFWREVIEQFIDRIDCPFSSQEFSG